MSTITTPEPDELSQPEVVFRRFGRRLVALARRRIHGPLAHRIDPEDVVQSAFKSFFVRHRAGRVQIWNANSLWGLLTRITVRKCADRVGYHRAARRDIGREAHADADAEPLWQAVADREPSPAEAAVLAETVEALFGTLDESDRPVLELCLQGYSAAEISLRLGRALRSVQRLRERVHAQLLRMGDCG
jgi:RNA polymerase sigma-70 factor (ECF subfamily)